jgi:hypothetical protein
MGLSLEEIGRIADVLRRNGVHVFKDGDLLFEMVAAASIMRGEIAPAPAMPEDTEPPEPQWCACTHMLVAHMPDGCMHGCNASLCSSGPATVEDPGPKKWIGHDRTVEETANREPNGEGSGQRRTAG